MRPTLVKLGSIPLRSYGVMMMVGFLVGLYRALRAGRKKGIEPAALTDAALYSLLSGVVGARLVFVLLNWPEFRRNLGSVFSVWEGGLSFHGGVACAVGVVYLYTRRKRISFLLLADTLAPSLAIAYGFTRIGCFLNGCCYGVQTHLPWAVKFPGVIGLRHPTQLYAAAASFFIYLLLVRIEKIHKADGTYASGHICRPEACKNDGLVFAAYLALYSLYRFLIEILRQGATAEVVFWGLTQAQLVSVVVLVAAGLALWRLGRSSR